ncbi:MAG: elongation factor P [Bacilli bacterium]|jgi:elongation factor P|nr:elongation factor P [Bacilli bacterium]
MTNSNDFKVGVTIEVDGNIYTILEFQHVKPGKGAAIVKTKLKNLRTGSIIEKTFNAGEKVALARIEKKNMQFLYEMNGTYYFMNMTTYEQIELDKSLVEYESKFLKENLEVIMMFYGDEVLGITLPDKVTMKIVRTESAVKGNTTSSAMKDAELETGLVVKVPLFINQDEDILVSTKDGKYVSRA